jgi:hypothetical protein
MSLVFNGIISGSLDISGSFVLAPQHPLPDGIPGMMAVSSSLSGLSYLYFYNGTIWREISLTP